MQHRGTVLMKANATHTYFSSCCKPYLHKFPRNVREFLFPLEVKNTKDKTPAKVWPGSEASGEITHPWETTLGAVRVCNSDSKF